MAGERKSRAMKISISEMPLFAMAAIENILCGFVMLVASAILWMVSSPKRHRHQLLIPENETVYVFSSNIKGADEDSESMSKPTDFQEDVGVRHAETITCHLDNKEVNKEKRCYREPCSPRVLYGRSNMMSKEELRQESEEFISKFKMRMRSENMITA